MHVLDNVIWCALTTKQAHLGEHRDGASKFIADVSLLGGIAEPTRSCYVAMASLLRAGERVGMFLAEAPSVPTLSIVSSVLLLQMVRGDQVVPRANDDSVVELTAADGPDMIALTQITKPGPFNERTRELEAISESAKLERSSRWPASASVWTATRT